jgi:hypothetical protein
MLATLSSSISVLVYGGVDLSETTHTAGSIEAKRYEVQHVM